ncbi:MAG: hypothetical protein NC037_06890 [Bacteroides sp.]|nr:hypothetical protein [Bacillota bacterium]MCM1394392.1 hypothetical protein [[Eubacterium] siraeum]MCM1456228.1 hypothetical protein [Bacteroides sp.]
MKKFNKIALILTVCLISVVLCVCLVACGDDDKDSHTHDWSAWQVTAPHDGETGSATRSCNVDGCNETQTATLPALSNVSYQFGANTATCGEDGLQSVSISLEGYGTVTFDIPSSATGNHATIEPKAAVAATCVAPGAEAYYECNVCHKKFSDSEGENEIAAPTPTQIDPDNHDIKEVAEVPATCKADGTESHYKCEDCHTLFSDQAGTSEIEETSLVISKDTASHVLTPHPVAAAKCNAKGTEAYWSCDVCEKLFSDSQGENEIDEPAEIDYAPHTPVHNNENPASCYLNGYEEYWNCDVCGLMFSDELCENEIDEWVVIPAGHNFVAVEADAAARTITKGGLSFKCIAHWWCDKCHEFLYLDENLTNQVTTVNYASRSGALLNIGYNKVDSTNTLQNYGYLVNRGTTFYIMTYVADCDGRYTFTLDNDEKITTIMYKTVESTSSVTVYVNSAWVNSATTENAYSKFVTAGESNPHGVTVDMLKGEYITIGVSVPTFSLNIDIDYLSVGDNMVWIEETYSEKDYTFTPSETRKYTLSVPEEFGVDMNGNPFADGGEDGLVFQGEEGVPITFTLISVEKAGVFKLTIDEVPLLNTEEAITISVMNYKEATSETGVKDPRYVLEMSKTLQAGKYKLTITSSENFMRENVLMAKNSSDTVDQLTGSTWLDGTADVYMDSYNSRILDTNDSSLYEITGSAPRTPRVITLDLDADDTLVFLANWGLNLTLTLELVELYE